MVFSEIQPLSLLVGQTLVPMEDPGRCYVLLFRRVTTLLRLRCLGPEKPEVCIEVTPKSI